MADIKQAAKWLNEGRAIRRNSWFEDLPSIVQTSFGYSIHWESFGDIPMRPKLMITEDLLAGDWELSK
jgi:hypothetical protein